MLTERQDVDYITFEPQKMCSWPQKVTDTQSEPQEMLTKTQDVDDITFEP